MASIIDSRGFRLTPDISPLTSALNQALNVRAVQNQQQELQKQRDEAQRLKDDFKTTGAQFLRIRDIGDFNTQRSEIAKLGQEAVRRGQDATVFTDALNATTPDELNLFLTRVATASANADKLLEEGLLRDQKERPANQIAKETRAQLRKDVSSIAKDASAVKSNFTKLNNLADEIRKGNRQAVSQGIVALVKLGDPGSVVRESEMAAALNSPNPVAAVSSLLKGKGTGDDVINSVTAAIDPLNPSNVNINDLLATANALVSSNVPTIQQRFATARELSDANLSEAGARSIFTDSLTRQIEGLNELLPQETIDKPAEQMSDEEILRALGG